MKFVCLGGLGEVAISVLDYFISSAGAMSLLRNFPVGAREGILKEGGANGGVGEMGLAESWAAR